MPKEKFVSHEGILLPLPEANVDTDQIVPARFLLRSRADGYGDALFADLRRDADGRPRERFVMNQPVFDEATILVANANFGCGSSREQAVWALLDGGIKVVVAPSFGDIFYNNALQNGLLPIRLPQAQVDALLAAVRAKPGARAQIDLAAQTLGCGDLVFPFEIDAHRKRALIEGLSEIDSTLGELPSIEAFEAQRFAAAPWLANPTKQA